MIKMDYLSIIDEFVLTNDPLIHIITCLDCKNLCNLIFVCKFYYYNNDIRKIIKKLRIDIYKQIISCSD